LKLGYVPNEKDRIRPRGRWNMQVTTLQLRSLRRALDTRRNTRRSSSNRKAGRTSGPGDGLDSAAQQRWKLAAGFDAERSLPKRIWNNQDQHDQLGFEEGNTYQYTFMIPFDYPALFAGIGGDEKVIPRLDKFFLKLRCWNLPCYNIENEPDFVVPYAYVFAGQPWKTQEVVTRIGKEVFKTTPDGIPGNDDLGATSGVYVWDALGFYPAVPGVGGLVLGTPMFDKATWRMAGGRTLVVSQARQRDLCAEGDAGWGGVCEVVAADC
jgi:hypothetical protein